MPHAPWTGAVGQVRLAGQTAWPDGPVDLTAMFAVHRGFRRDLDRFVAAATRTPSDDRAAWRLLVRRWALLRRILREHHRGGDAALCSALSGRVTAAEQHVLAALAAERGVLDPLLDRVGDGLARMAGSGDDGTRAAVEVRLVAARERIAHHLCRVERDALPLVQRHLSPAQWRASFRRPRDVAWVLHGLPEHAATRFLAGTPVVRLRWRLFLRRPFARRERQTFG